MKIGVNISWMTPGAAGGMEWYLRSLLEHLSRIDRDNRYLLVTSPNNYQTFAPLPRRWDMVVYCGQEQLPTNFRERAPVAATKPAWYSLLRHVGRRLQGNFVRRWDGRLAQLLARERVDLWFCPFMYALPTDAAVPVVNTIPDLQHEHYPEFFPEHELTMRRMGYQYSCRAATATLGISRFVADDIVQRYGVAPSRVFGIPLGLDPFIATARPRLASLVAGVRRKYQLDGEFVFYPANGWPHKNHATLVQAWHEVVRQRPSLQLVLTGCPFDLLEKLKPLLQEPAMQQSVRHLGYVSRDEVVGLYGAARMLVFPSRFEGFGLPLLEAMHLGVPVACSNIGSLPEVGGDAVVYFDPLSARQIADAILTVTGDEGVRRRLVAAGNEQQLRFNYARTAEETLGVFRKVGSGELQPPGEAPVRPLSPGRFLDQGVGRWFFRLDGVRQLKVQVLPPQQAAAGQTLALSLNGRRVLDAALERPGLCEFVVAPGDCGRGDFHRLELHAPHHGSAPGNPAVQVVSVIAVGPSDNEVKLVA